MSGLTDRIDSILRLLRQGIDVSTLNTEDVIDTLLRDLRAEISATAADKERLDWIEAMTPDTPEAIVRRWLSHGVGYTVRRAIDDARESAG